MTPKNRQKSFAVALLAVILLVPPLDARGGNTALAGFRKLQSLEGDWQGTDDRGQAVRSYFAPIAANTAVMESVTTSSEEMVSLYSMEDDSILLVHYCPSNRQPRLRAVPSSGSIRQLVFSFVRAVNLPNPAAAYKFRLVIEFADQDHITETWTWRRNHQDSEIVFHLARLHLSRN